MCKTFLSTRSLKNSQQDSVETDLVYEASKCGFLLYSKKSEVLLLLPLWDVSKRLTQFKIAIALKLGPYF